jgi:hypothetical protein
VQCVILDTAGKVIAVTANTTGILSAAGIKTLPLTAALPVSPADALYAGIVSASIGVAVLRGVLLAGTGQQQALGVGMPEQFGGSIAGVAQPLAVGANLGTALGSQTTLPVLSLRVD